MKVVNTVKELQRELSKLQTGPVGFVPTMGALHNGHLSLVSKASVECPHVVVSIYVNPTQFNDKNDLKNYPRTLGADLQLLGKVLRTGDIVFAPDDREIYPGKDSRSFSFGNLDKVMEAVQRPGHFNGVAQVVSRLFDIVKPDIAYFGLKDFQQLAVVKDLVRQTGNKVKITGCPIVREDDGLAMSSRNRLIDPGIRANASVIYRTISAASGMLDEHEIAEIKIFVTGSINNIPGFEVEYYEIVDDIELIPVSSRQEMKKGRHYYGCIAVRAGTVRLIDNVEIGLV
jgi:pantoate--beta-alanine ligase